MKAILSTFVFTLFHALSLCQPVSDFDLKSSACFDEAIKMINQSVGGNSYEWDFCPGDLNNSPVANTLDASVGPPYKVEFIEEGGQYHAFFTTRGVAKLFRLDFGNNIDNTPTKVDLGNLGLNFDPIGFLSVEIVKEGNNYYGFVLDYYDRLYRFDFGSSLTNSPTNAQVIYSGGLLANPIDMVIPNDPNEKFIFLANSVGGRIIRLNFDDSFISVPSADFVNIGQGGQGGFSFIKENNNWYSIVSTFSGLLMRVLFDDGLQDLTPVISQINGVPFNPDYRGLSIAFDNNSYYVFAQSPTKLYRVSLGNSIANDAIAGSDLGGFNLLGNVWGFSMYKVESDWLAFSSENSGTNSIYRLKFPQNCFSTTKFSVEFEPTVVVKNSGAYNVTLTVKDLNDNSATSSNPISVLNETSPDIIFSNQNNCVDHDLIFNSINESDNIIDYAWSFGDTQTSLDPNPTHTYTVSGDYNVSLQVTADNGCNNYTEKIISIYNEPIPDFQIPIANPFCSNQNYLFDNTSTIDPGYPVAWQWTVNGVDVSSTEDLNFAFTTTTNQDISLTASIPGCENEMIKSISSLLEGPVPDFSFTGQCEDENVIFTNSSSGTTDGYSWNFDDGQNSTDTNPTHTFSAIGVYDVTLTTYNSVTGCNNTKTKSASIYSKPQVNFLLSPPPFSCNGTPSQFNDLTPSPPDSNIASWAWNFGDAGSSQNTSTLKNPQHIYANPGGYNVSLLVGTNFFCSATLQLPITISQAPVANFNNTATCEDVPVNFTDASVGTINGWSWTIGSTIYNSQNPTHTFANSGNTSATLNVTASNGCIGTMNKPIIVPVKLTPDFSVNRNCVNQQTAFTDITNASADPVSTRSWIFGSLGTANGSPVNFTFPNTGSVPVSLTVTTQAGCVYPISKSVSIIQSPQANFTPSPLAGAPPLSVLFTNTSTNATSYQWAFHDQNNSTSTAVSPTFVYQVLGEYQAELTASNAQNCFHTTSKTIRVVQPVVDVALGGLELMEFQNGFKPAVTIFNHGNVPIINLDLLLNLSGPVIRERVNAIIIPNTSYRHVLSFEFPTTTDIDYFCVEAEVIDITPNDNEVCLGLEQSFTTFPPYPNPSKGSFQLDWITKEPGIVNLTVINSMGQEERNLQIESVEGRNPLVLETYGLSAGVYFIRIKYQQFTKLYRVFVSE